MNYRTMKKAGPLRNGWERGKGSILHAVPFAQGDSDAAIQADGQGGRMWPAASHYVE